MNCFLKKMSSIEAAMSMAWVLIEVHNHRNNIRLKHSQLRLRSAVKGIAGMG